jgi:tRNA/rRNA methyltransferase
MLNCGLADLRLVQPRDGWPSPAALAAASGADAVLEATRLYERLEEAIADLRLVYAATARRRDMNQRVVTPREAAREMRAAAAAGERAGVVFGPERTGLDNDAVALSDAVLMAPLNPRFSSLNLAQAVLLVGWEWYRGAAPEVPRQRRRPGRGQRATSAELVSFFEHLEEQLDAAGFLLPMEKRPTMVRNLRNLFLRAAPTEHEVRTLHGVVTALSGRRKGEG